jgi:hypothetical protein
MFVIIRFAPQRVRTAASFHAPDPWNAQRPTTFTIEVYKLVPRGGRAPHARPSPTDLYGIRSEIDGVERMLPEALSELWSTRRITPESLPRLLAELSPNMRKGDIQPLLHTKRHIWTGAIFGLLGFGCLAMSVVWGARAYAARGHQPSRLPIAAWLGRPQVEDEYIQAEGTVRVEGRQSVDFVPQAMPALIPFPGPNHYSLAWFRAGDGYRVLLQPAGGMSALPEAPVNGVTLRPAAIGLPAQALADLHKRLPKVDTSFVTCQFWGWDDAYSTPLGPVFWLALALIFALGGAVPAIVIVRQKARRRRQIEWALGRV